MLHNKERAGFAWNTYQDKELSFTMKYPANWELGKIKSISGDDAYPQISVVSNPVTEDVAQSYVVVLPRGGADYGMLPPYRKEQHRISGYTTEWQWQASKTNVPDVVFFKEIPEIWKGGDTPRIHTENSSKELWDRFIAELEIQ